jgi:cytochrome c-type biogenesis protein
MGIAVLFLLLMVTQPVSGIVILQYFHQQGCINCEKTDPLVENIRTNYRDRVVVESIEIDDREGVRLLMSYGVTEIPVIVINRNRVLSWNEITPERLDAEVRLAESGACPVPEKRKTLLDTDAVPAIIVAFILGLMTGISPCLLGSLVLLVAAGGGHDAARGGRYYPIVFGAGVITAYLVASIAILGVGLAFRPDTGSRLVIYSLAGLIAIIAGLVQIGVFPVPEQLNRHTTAVVSRFRTLPGTFVLGIVFTVLFAPCAIAPFLILIGTLLMSSTLTPLLLLPAFSAGILVPFVLITLLQRTIPEKLLAYAGIVRKAGGILLVLFGIWLILSR